MSSNVSNPIDAVVAEEPKAASLLTVPKITHGIVSFAISAGASAIGATESDHRPKSVLRTEGLRGLYRGLMPNLLGQVPEKAIRLFVVERARAAFIDRSIQPDEQQLLPELVAGMAAGSLQVLITNPAEIVKVNMQVASQSKMQIRLLPFVRELGWRGLYRGASACSSGVFASSLTTPADVIKTRLQVKGNHYKGVLDCFKSLLVNEGWRSLFKGLFPRVARSAPQYGVMLLTYDILSELLLPPHEGIRRPIPEPLELGLAKMTDSVVEDKWRRMRFWSPPRGFQDGLATLQRVAVGGQGSVWGIDDDGAVWKWTGFDWRQVSGQLDYISVGADGAVFGVRNQQLQRFDPWQMKFITIQSVPVAKVSVGNADKVWFLDEDGYPHKLRAGAVVRRRGNRKMKHVSVGADGTVWAVEKLSVGGKNSVWGIGMDGQYYHWDSIAFKWNAADKGQLRSDGDAALPLARGKVDMADVENEKVGSISVASDGTVIASSGPRHVVVGYDDASNRSKIKLTGKSITYDEGELEISNADDFS